MKKDEIMQIVFPYADKPVAFKNVPTYLIHKVEEDSYLIHRELFANEKNDYEPDEILELDGKWYLFCILNVPNRETAELVIKQYWSAFLTFPQLH